MQSYTQKYKDIILPILVRHAPDAKVILYGSRARQDDTSGSDIDIALDAGTKMNSSIISAILEELEESSLPIFFDVVDYHSVSEHMQSEISKDGVVWRE